MSAVPAIVGHHNALVIQGSRIASPALRPASSITPTQPPANRFDSLPGQTPKQSSVNSSALYHLTQRGALELLNSLALNGGLGTYVDTYA